jgi:hypothetical protein
MANDDSKSWNLANWIIIGMAGVIGAMVVAGFSSLKTDSQQGFAAVYARLSQIEGAVTSTNAEVKQMGKDLTRIDTLQRIRLDREQREENNKGRKLQ